MNIFSNFITLRIGFLLTLVFGVWLSKSGKPYNGALFTTHKLIALCTLIVTAIHISRMLKGAESPVVIILLIIIASLCIAALFATGALMSMEKLNYRGMLTIHKIASALVILTLGPAIFLLIQQSIK